MPPSWCYYEEIEQYLVYGRASLRPLQLMRPQWALHLYRPCANSRCELLNVTVRNYNHLWFSVFIFFILFFMFLFCSFLFFYYVYVLRLYSMRWIENYHKGQNTLLENMGKKILAGWEKKKSWR